MVNHIYDDTTDQTFCGSHSGDTARHISGAPVSCPDCAVVYGLCLECQEIMPCLMCGAGC